MSKKNIPAVSIIIPMYNAEKYVGECLDSILAQTFTDYEVIIVDDCSTDKSCAVVENYLPKFNSDECDKLKLIKSKINSGSAGVPRNIGIMVSCGKYILFVDSDDAIIATALEELYKYAEDFQVDVVHCGKHYRAPGETVTTDIKMLKEATGERGELVKEPTMISDKLEIRVREFGEQKIIGYTWNSLIRRNLIAENALNFPKLRSGEDHFFSFYVLCLAKSILRVPKPYYVYRHNSNSITLGKLSVDKMIHRWSDPFFRGVKILDEFMDKFELFRQNHGYRYIVFETILKYHLINLLPIYGQIQSYKLDKLIRTELSALNGDTTSLISFLFNIMNSQRVDKIRLSQHIKKQQAVIQQLQAQIKKLQTDNAGTFSLT